MGRNLRGLSDRSSIVEVTSGHLPVLLVPGWSDHSRALRRIEAYLTARGWNPDQVRALEFRDRFGSNVEHAEEIASAASALASDNGREKIDVVAHSMGGLAVRYLLSNTPSPPIRRLICLGTPHLGTWASYLAWGEGAPEMRVDSQFVSGLKKPLDGTQLFAIHTPFDLRIFPPRSAWLEGAENHRLWCGGHRRLLRSKRVFERIEDLLKRPES